MYKYYSFILMCLLSSLSYAFNADDFFQPPSTISAKLSPSGSAIAVIKYAKEYNVVALIDPQNQSETIVLDTRKIADKKSTLHHISWIDDRYLAAQFSEKKDGISGFRDTQKLNSTIIIDTDTSTAEQASVKKIYTKGWLVDTLPEQPGVFIYAKRLAYSKLYRIKVDQLAEVDKKRSKFEKIDGGQFIKSNEIYSLKGYVSVWFLDDQGQPKSALKYNDEDALELVDLSGDSEDLKVLKKWSKKELKPEDDSDRTKILLPVAAAEEAFTFYCLDDAEDEERHIYKVNFDTGEEELIYTANAYKIIDLIFSNQSTRLIGVKLLAEGKVIDTFFDTEQVNTLASNFDVTVDLGFSLDNQFKLTYSESFQQAGQYHFHDLKSGQPVAVAYTYPHLKKPLTGRQTTGKISNGMDISYLLNLPLDDTSAPLIVMPHGGPIGVYDSPYFDLFTQYFVANGFAVLRVNFRGSSGFSSELEDAGKLQWGDLMLADIHSAASKVINRPDIDKNKVCLFGVSYGGYAATMLAIKQPDFYRCAVNVAGLSDLNLLIDDSGDSKRARQWYKEQLVDDETGVSYSEQLKPISPVYLASELNIPLLIAHGTKDKTVDMEHAYRLKLMLEKHNKIFEWLPLAHATHSFSETSDLRKLLGASLSFIERHMN